MLWRSFITGAERPRTSWGWPGRSAMVYSSRLGSSFGPSQWCSGSSG